MVSRLVEITLAKIVMTRVQLDFLKHQHRTYD